MGRGWGSCRAGRYQFLGGCSGFLGGGFFSGPPHSKALGPLIWPGLPALEPVLPLTRLGGVCPGSVPRAFHLSRPVLGGSGTGAPRRRLAAVPRPAAPRAPAPGFLTRRAGSGGPPAAGPPADAVALVPAAAA